MEAYIAGYEVGEALSRIGKGQVADFKARWPGLRTWDEEVGGLLRAYSALLETELG